MKAMNRYKFLRIDNKANRQILPRDHAMLKTRTNWIVAIAGTCTLLFLSMIFYAWGRSPDVAG